MKIYQKSDSLSKQAASLFVRMSRVIIIKNSKEETVKIALRRRPDMREAAPKCKLDVHVA
jgi:hypothetical protein